MALYEALDALAQFWLLRKSFAKVLAQFAHLNR
jgi:hypothetical protein